MKAKLIIAILALTAAFSFTSCGDDEPTPKFRSEYLVGVWYVTDVEGESPWTWLVKNAEYTFNANGTCKTPVGMEDSWKITLGQLHTFHAENNEPMFIYEMVKEGSANFTARIKGTLNESGISVLVSFESAKVRM